MLEKLTISYQMQLSSTAQANKEINNNGTLDFGFGVSTKKVSVYTGSKQFVKIETNKPDKRLAGAVFLLKQSRKLPPANSQRIQVDKERIRCASPDFR